MSPFERLLHELPPERRVDAALALEKLAHDHDSPVYNLYAEILAGIHAQNQALETRMEKSANQRDQRLSKDHADNQQAILNEVGALSGKTLWHRFVVSRIVGAVIWTAVVVGLTNYIVTTKVKTVDPQFHAMIEELKVESLAQQNRLDTVVENQRKTVEYLSSVEKSAAVISSHTIVGESLAEYITKIERNRITLTVPDQRKGMAEFQVPHTMTEKAYNQLKAAYFYKKNSD